MACLLQWFSSGVMQGSEHGEFFLVANSLLEMRHSESWPPAGRDGLVFAEVGYALAAFPSHGMSQSSYRRF